LKSLNDVADKGVYGAMEGQDATGGGGQDGDDEGGEGGPGPLGTANNQH
jgi:hypothetical protein